MDLNTVWFILVAILFTGFFFLEGFDYGVGILMPFLGRDNTERRGIINAIGPVWDGNEVWMITAGGALFASFPHVYASLFSGFYLALILILVALILRGVGFEFRGKREAQGWHTFWDWAIFTGSLLPAFLWGVTVANLMRGFAIEQDMNYYGGLLPLLNPYALLGGLVFVALFIMHGANFLVLKAPEEVVGRARKAAFTGWIVAAVLTVAFVAWTFFATDILTKPGLNGLVPAVLAAAALLGTDQEKRLGFHCRCTDGCLRDGDGVYGIVPAHPDLESQPGLEPDDHQCRFQPVHAQGDDHRGGHFCTDRAGLPGLDVLGLPQARGERDGSFDLLNPVRDA
jgi:cytochrome d ubiquinol oxidase subunit II